MINAENPGIEEAAQRLRSSGASVQAVQADLRKYDGVEKLWQAVKQTGRPVDAIAINAGVGTGGEFAQDTELQTELEMIDLNVKSTVHLAKRVSADMVSRGEGRILFTSSIASIMPTPFQAVYGATKAFVQSFSESLRSELKDSGATVTALQPVPPILISSAGQTWKTPRSAAKASMKMIRPMSLARDMTH